MFFIFRFVYLPDCGHTLEVNGFERWLAWQDSQVCIRTCPRCKTPISTKMRRYQPHIMEIYSDMSTIRHKMYKHVDTDARLKLLETNKRLRNIPCLKGIYFITLIHTFMITITAKLR